jgi:hypothetical protein
VLRGRSFWLREVAGGKVDFELPDEGLWNRRCGALAGEGDGSLTLLTTQAVGNLIAEKLGSRVIHWMDQADA